MPLLPDDSPAARPLAQDWPPAVLDLEASGFGRDSYPIEVGVVLPDGRSWCSLIRPEPDWTHWDAEAARLHGLERDGLLQHGRAPCDVARTLNTWLDGQSVYCDAWAHDYPWLHRLFDAARVPLRFRLLSVQTLLDDPGMNAWARSHDAMGRALQATRHRASHDARVIQATLAVLARPSRAGQGLSSD